jgi:5'-3' exonuclease
MASIAGEIIVIDPSSPIIVIDISMLFYNAYYESLSKFYLANGDVRIAQKEMFREIRAISAPNISTFKTLARLIISRGDTINYREIHKNEDFLSLFKRIIARLIEHICKTVSRKPYKFGNSILIKDCYRKDNWRVAKLFPDYKKPRGTQNNVARQFQFNYEVIDEFWQTVYPNLHNKLGIKVLSLPTIEADDLAYFAKKQIRQQFPTAELIIVTGDYDYLQLVDSNTKIMTFDGIDLNKRGFGSPELNLVIKILTGDASDNLSPIYAGCGEKTAQKLLERLYPQNATDINKCAKNFIQAIENINNIDQVVRDIIGIVTNSQTSQEPPTPSTRTRGRQTITRTSRTQSLTQEDMLQKLRRNILIIQMAKIPNIYFIDFTTKYQIIDLETARQRFNTMIPTQQITDSNSAPLPTVISPTSRSRRIKNQSAGNIN